MTEFARRLPGDAGAGVGIDGGGDLESPGTVVDPRRSGLLQKIVLT